MNKKELRKRLIALDFSEKVKILERLRDRSLALAAAGLRKEDYIKHHLFNELRWLLHAATEWSVQAQLELGIVGYNVQVYAMDSAFVHARALFEFFLSPPSRNHHSAKQFLPLVLTSDLYDDWKDPLHKFLMHADNRSFPRQLRTADGPKDLNRMPVCFAKEVLRLWREFEQGLARSSSPEDQHLAKVAREKRKEAIEGAECVVHSEVAKQHAKDKQQTLAPVFVFD